MDFFIFGATCAVRQFYMPNDKGKDILRQMREDVSPKQHLDQKKIRARAALALAVQNRDKKAFTAALIELKIDPDGKEGTAHLREFDNLN
jgi:hypothetical protein